MIISNVQARPPSRQPIATSNTHTCYYCGCGVQFTDRQLFRQHSLCVHDGQYIEGSSHFIVAFTGIALPVNRDTRVQPQKQLKTNVPVRKGKGNEKCVNKPAKINHVPAKKTKITEQIKPNPPTNQVRQQKQRNPQPILTTPAIKQQQLVWNGFRLIKNNKCDAFSYYCGVCTIDFSLPQQYIIHCLDVCQSLRSPRSSHFITCVLDEQQQEENQTMGITSTMNEEGNTDRRTTAKRDRIGAETSNHARQNPISLMYKKKVKDHKDLPFYCGSCHQTFAHNLAYLWHIKNSHSQIVPLSSSHIILRSLFLHDRCGILYISINQPSNYQNWFCPCKPERKMLIKEFVKHVMEVHRGISPFYSYSVSYNYSQKGILKHQKKHTAIPQPIIQIPQLPVDPILAINRKQVSQKMDFLLECLTCSAKFASKGYMRHLPMHEGRQFDFSHVILRTKVNSQVKNCYITVGEEWPDKKAVYYCPCQPMKNIRMGELMRHIIDVHQYVSPVYYFSN